jgi:hypothetical protein
MSQTRITRSIPLERWPLAYRLAFERALAPDDDGSGEHGRAAHLRSATIESYSQTYGLYLDFLDRTDTQRTID